MKKAFRFLGIIGFIWVGSHLLFAQEQKPVIQQDRARAQKIEIPYQFFRGTSPIPGRFHQPDPSITDYHFGHVFHEIKHPEDDSLETWKAQELEKKRRFRPDNEETDANPASKTQTVSPQLGTNFAGNPFDGCYPPDNTVAYSPAGYIVSVTNCNIRYYTTSGTQLYAKSLSAFFNNQYTAFLYDPVILYDSGVDRFIMVILHGADPSTSKVLLCVSKSNNPQNGWYIYELPGDPASGTRWFDYPKLAVSQSDIFISGNLFDSSNNFDESILYQITKTPALSGQPINYGYWTGLTYSPFTLLPVSYGGSGNYGPGIYVVAVSRTSNAIRLYDITDDLTGNPQMQAYSISVSKNITIGADAEQANTSILLSVGDTRALSGFYKDGIIHFVHNNGVGGGYNGIMYHRLNVANLTDWSSIYQESGYDCVYPSVAWFGTSTNDKTVLVNFLRSSASIYPEHRVVVCDNSGTWSSSLLVKNGTTYVDKGRNGVSRWGDYTGVSRDHANNYVWVSGCYGSNGSYGNNALYTWIAQIRPQGIASVEEKQNQEVAVNLFPNPAIELVSLELTISKPQKVSIQLVDEKGALIQQFIQGDRFHAGTHKVTMNIKVLPKGLYYFTITDESGNILATKPILVQ